MLDRTPVEVVMTDDETMLVSFVGGAANFTASHLKSKRDVAELFLMLMTYNQVRGLSK
jgi:hypothetical protein